jgi:hypothetical protein
MKRLENWRSLDEFGIDLLTGESCGYMFRYLCDVTARGKRIIEKCLDCELKLHENWNRGSPSDPHIGSVMLSPQFFAPLAAFALLDDGFAEVWILKSGTVVGIEKDEDPERSKFWRTAYEGHIDRILRNVAPRHTHQMSGRTV